MHAAALGLAMLGSAGITDGRHFQELMSENRNSHLRAPAGYPKWLKPED